MGIRTAFGMAAGLATIMALTGCESGSTTEDRAATPTRTATPTPTGTLCESAGKGISWVSTEQAWTVTHAHGLAVPDGGSMTGKFEAEAVTTVKTSVNRTFGSEVPARDVLASLAKKTGLELAANGEATSTKPVTDDTAGKLGPGSYVVYAATRTVSGYYQAYLCDAQGEELEEVFGKAQAWETPETPGILNCAETPDKGSPAVRAKKDYCD